MQLPKTHGAECSTYILLNWNQATFNGTHTWNFCERRRRKALGGLGASPPPAPRKFSNLKALKRHFQQADSCVKKVWKIDRFFLLNFDKKGVAFSCIIFSYLIIIIILLYCSQNTILISYQWPKRKQYTFIFCSFTLRALVYSYLAGKKIGHQCLIVSRCKWIVELAANVWFRNAGKVESLPIEQACIVLRFYFVVLASFIMHDCNSEFTCMTKLNGFFDLMTYYDNLTKIYFSAWLACASWSSKSGYWPCSDWSWVGIRDSQVESGQSRLFWDNWTLCKGFWRYGGMLPRKN